MGNASLVPYYYVRNILDLCLTKHMQNGRSNILIDGFPRSEEQAQFFIGKESIQKFQEREIDVFCRAGKQRQFFTFIALKMLCSRAY